MIDSGIPSTTDPRWPPAFSCSLIVNTSHVLSTEESGQLLMVAEGTRVGMWARRAATSLPQWSVSMKHWLGVCA